MKDFAKMEKFVAARDYKCDGIKSHFFDSGAFSLWPKAKKYAEENDVSRWAYFDTPEFWEYCAGYAEFIKKYPEAFDYYANMDVIGNPELTWRNQQYLEKKGLKPVPVVHYKTDLKWLQMYIDKGYDFIGLGGLVGNTMRDGCKCWLDVAFKMICDTPERLPKVRIHGFGITAPWLLNRYPWYSVDSAAWDKASSYGRIYVPQKRKGKFVFDADPYVMIVSVESKHRLSPSHRQLMEEWLERINVPPGSVNADGTVKKKGVITYHPYRRIANMLFFYNMSQSLRPYPWPFYSNLMQ